MIFPKLAFPDTCNIRPVASWGHAPGAEDQEAATAPLLGVKCWYQERKATDAAQVDARGQLLGSMIFFQDASPVREVLEGLAEDSVIEVTHRKGIALKEPLNAVASRAFLSAVVNTGLWQVDCKARA